MLEEAVIMRKLTIPGLLVGCHRETRACYHCGWECEMLVLDGYTLVEPSRHDYCCGPGHHERFAIQDRRYLLEDAPPQMVRKT